MSLINYSELAKSISKEVETTHEELQSRQYVPVLRVMGERSIKFRVLPDTKENKLSRRVWYYSTSRGKFSSDCARKSDLEAISKLAENKSLDDAWKYSPMEQVMMLAYIEDIANPNDYDKGCIGKTVILLLRREHASLILEQIQSLPEQELTNFLNGSMSQPLLHLTSRQKEDRSWESTCNFLKVSLEVPEEQLPHNIEYFEGLSKSYVLEDSNPTDEDLRELRKEVEKKSATKHGDYTSDDPVSVLSSSSSSLRSEVTDEPTSVTNDEESPFVEQKSKGSDLDDLLSKLNSKD